MPDRSDHDVARACAELERIALQLRAEFDRLDVPLLERGKILHQWGLGLLVAAGVDDDALDEITDAALEKVDAEMAAFEAAQRKATR